MTWDAPLEKDIEAYLVRQAKRLGALAYKFTAPGRRSVPDRLVLLPGGRACFIEVKRPGGKPTARQLAEHAKIRALGHRVHVADTREAVDEVLAGEDHW